MIATYLTDPQHRDFFVDLVLGKPCDDMLQTCHCRVQVVWSARQS
jgi:hypothetical protein